MATSISKFYCAIKKWLLDGAILMGVTRPKVGNSSHMITERPLIFSVVWVKSLVYEIDLADLQSIPRKFSALIDSPTRYVNFHRQRKCY